MKILTWKNLAVQQRIAIDTQVSEEYWSKSILVVYDDYKKSLDDCKR